MQQNLFDINENGNGVKPRHDKEGSEFGKIHRKLPKNCLITDIDVMTLEANVKLFIQHDYQNELFIEYRMLNWDKAECYFPAIIDIKNNIAPSVFEEIENIGNCNRNRPSGTGAGSSLWAHMKHAKLLTEAQHKHGWPGCRFLIFALTLGHSPVTIYEINIDTGERQIIYTLHYTEENCAEKIKECYYKIGLLK